MLIRMELEAVIRFDVGRSMRQLGRAALLCVPVCAAAWSCRFPLVCAAAWSCRYFGCFPFVARFVSDLILN